MCVVEASERRLGRQSSLWPLKAHQYQTNSLFYPGDSMVALLINPCRQTTYVDLTSWKRPSRKKPYFQTNLTLGVIGKIGKMHPARSSSGPTPLRSVRATSYGPATLRCGGQLPSRGRLGYRNEGTRDAKAWRLAPLLAKEGLGEVLHRGLTPLFPPFVRGEVGDDCL